MSRCTILNSLYICFCRFLNALPFFHASCDSCFDSICHDLSLENIRLSLIHVNVGCKHVYIISYSHETGFDFYFVLNLYSFHQPIDVMKLERDYFALVDDADETKSKLRADFISLKINECQNGIGILHNKVNNYIAIALAYTGFYAFLSQSVINLSSMPANFIMVLVWLALFISGVNLLSVLFLLRHYMKVRAFPRSKFSEFKFEPNVKKLSYGMYIDWQSYKNELEVSASLVKNIEKYFIRSIFIGVILLFCVLFEPYDSRFFDRGGVDNNNGAYVIALVNENGEFSAKNLSDLSREISSRKKVSFIYSSSNSYGKKVAQFVTEVLRISSQSSFFEFKREAINEKVLIVIVEG